MAAWQCGRFALAQVRDRHLSVETVPSQDACWLWADSESAPMVPSLMCVFSPPTGSESDFVTRLMEEMRRYTVPTAPFDRRCRRVGLGRVVKQWEIVDKIDLDYHLSRSRLPDQADESDFLARVSQLHAMGLDPTHPLWRVEIVEGLANGRFAMILKIHHSIVDGIAAVGFLHGCLADNSEQRACPPIWAYRRPPSPGATEPRGLGRRLSLLLDRPDPRKPLRWLAQAGSAIGGGAFGLSARPWSSPHSALNKQITADRLILTRSHELARYRALSQRTGGTVNDVLLAVCAGALRAYLHEIGQLPDRSLTATIPLSVRTRGRHRDASTAITQATLCLGTDVADVRERFQGICASTTVIKRRLARMSDRTIDVYTALAALPVLFQELTRTAGRLRPPFNFLVSNVPGPREHLYWNGAKMDEMQAIPVLFSSSSVVVIVTSYAEHFAFAFTACPAILPDCACLPSRVDAALAELEAVFPG
jgi:WS/DGAT/MGAT family acyltransferase